MALLCLDYFINIKSLKVKKIFLIVAILATTITHYSFAQDSTKQYQLPQLLTSYYNIKNALVAGDATSASANALAFTKTVNSIDYKVISEGNIHTLASDAGKIAETKDIKKQREYFANFSINMAAIAKAVKLTDQPVYHAYCPMKKAYWLSNEKAIKNPYYGSSMLTCGKVTETF
jgi:hypothetical protein